MDGKNQNYSEKQIKAIADVKKWIIVCKAISLHKIATKTLQSKLKNGGSHFATRKIHVQNFLQIKRIKFSCGQKLWQMLGFLYQRKH